MPGYNPQAIEKKWQERWAAAKVFASGAVGAGAMGVDAAKPKFYVLDMFPYPSGQGLHVGHPEGYTATDIVARYKRGKGFNVMHPMGWDAFGLPAEQYAIKNNVHPRETTANNINRFRGQLQALGFSYDWDREVDTTDPGYYRWTQWIFLKLYDTWFDEERQKGRAIGELAAELASGKRDYRSAYSNSAAEHMPPWNSLAPFEQRRELAAYRLAYEKLADVNWCQALGTVLANEEVIDGKSEVGGFPVERKPMRQWMLRITAYSERLLTGLDKLEWTHSLKEMQRNWIGKSEGAEVEFGFGQKPLQVFTTRPDTLFGATYVVLAPEFVEFFNPMGVAIPAGWPENTPEEWKGTNPNLSPIEAVSAYRQWSSARSERERQEDTRKTGTFTGLFAVNPVNGRRIPVFISDYVLIGYGTGAIMAVPGHDERDHEFAVKFKLPIVQVVETRGHEGAKKIDIQKEPFVEEGVAVNSPWIEGLGTAEAKAKMIGMLEEKGIGKRRVNYKIRDWLFSRQRYWGEPFPIVHLEDGTTVRLADEELPVRLPELVDFRPTGTIEPPLSKAAAWKDVQVSVDANHVARVVAAGTPGAVKARRELNTMPQWAGSCWYYIRYVDARNAERFVDPAAEKYWLHNGVDLYVGGVEHAVLHLLYSRFWHKVLFDWGLVSCEEPFRRLVNQGLILGEMEYSVVEEIATRKRLSAVGLPAEIERSLDDDEGKYRLIKLDDSEVEKKGGGEGFVMKADPSIRVDARSFKMSKSRGNVVNPDDVIREYGADSLRMFEMFMGPLEQVKPWSTAGVEGVYRFLQRVWRNLFDENDLPKVVASEKESVRRGLHKLIKKVGEDIERLSFNTAIAEMMKFNNLIGEAGGISRESAVAFVRLIEPFAPHFAEEVYERIETQNAKRETRNEDVTSVSRLPWPSYDPAMLIEATIEVPVQVNGKLRSRITVASDADEGTVLAAALADAEVVKFLAGKEPKKKIYVKGRMVNLVI